MLYAVLLDTAFACRSVELGHKGTERGVASPCLSQDGCLFSCQVIIQPNRVLAYEYSIQRVCVRTKFRSTSPMLCLANVLFNEVGNRLAFTVQIVGLRHDSCVDSVVDSISSSPHPSRRC